MRRQNAELKLGEEPYTSALLFENSHTFSQHLQSRTEKISATIKDLFSRLPQTSPEVLDLQRRLNDLLAREKDATAELRRVQDERDSLQERLEQASYRYMTAEKKLDRVKSSQVQKLERAAMMGGAPDAPSPSKKSATVKKEHSEVNGELENGEASAEAEAARIEALAAAEKQRAQVEEIESENERLTNELSAARTKLVSLTDEDYAETALCKTIRSRYEDAIKKLNDLEATNKQLREDMQKLQSERLSYRSAVDDEHRTNNEEIEAQIARAENDLARIRTQRDNLQAEVNVLRSGNDTRRSAAEQSKELAAARDSRIAALESELERTKLQLGEVKGAGSEDIDAMDPEALKDKLRTLEQQYSLLSNELPSMEAAWRKTQVLASRKVEEMSTMEEHVARMSAEKTKAEQKYFAIMKNKETQAIELQRLKTQSARSTEIVSQLKEADGRSRELASNLERQLAERGERLLQLEQIVRTLEQRGKEAGVSTEGLKKQVDELKAMISSKEKDCLGSNKAKRDAELELETCKTRLDDTRRQLENTKKTVSQNNESSSDSWRVSFPICSPLRNTRRSADAKFPETGHLLRLLAESPRHGAQALRAHVLQVVRQGSHFEPVEKVSGVWQGFWEWRSAADCACVSTSGLEISGALTRFRMFLALPFLWFRGVLSPVANIQAALGWIEGMGLVRGG